MCIRDSVYIRTVFSRAGANGSSWRVSVLYKRIVISLRRPILSLDRRFAANRSRQAARDADDAAAVLRHHDLDLAVARLVLDVDLGDLRELGPAHLAGRQP